MPKYFRRPSVRSVLIPFLLLLFLLPPLFSSCRKKEIPDMKNPPEPAPAPMIPVGHLIDPDSEVRGVWIASVWNLDYPSRADLSADELRAELDEILAVLSENGFNTLFFQVRPAGDALYESSLFPISAAISSAGDLPFDPLRYLVETARPRNIRVFAWVNPLRATLTGTDPSALPDGHPAKEHPEWTVPYADGRLYFNAGLPEVRRFVADGVREIVTKYDVDGVVFDDYFYPYPVKDDAGRQVDFDDRDTYGRYGGDFADIGDWRRENVNLLIREVFETVHFIDPECVFGVSPYGVWQNDDGENGGSDSASFEAYKSLYCDATAWIDGGYVDFISPQIYWDFDTAQAPFDTMVRWWNDRLDGTGVKLWVSHAAYKYGEDDWSNPAGQLNEQITFARSERSYYGSILYGYDELKQNTRGAAEDAKSAFSPEIIYSPTLSNGLGVTVSSPVSGTELDDASTWIMGVSDPYYPLTVNGRKLGRTKSGYFSFTTDLSNGENTFVFEQNGKKYVYTLWYGKKSGTVDKTEMAEEPDPDPDAEPEEELTVLDYLSVPWSYPEYEVMTDEDILWVSCTAPAGSEVTADIGGFVTKLVPLSKPSKEKTEDGWVYIAYGANAKLPTPPEGLLYDCGKIRFTATHPDSPEPMTRDGIRVRTLGESAGVPVRVKEDYTSLKISRRSSYYNDYSVQSAGMTDEAVALRDGFYVLRMGGFIAEGDVEELSVVQLQNAISENGLEDMAPQPPPVTEAVPEADEDPAEPDEAPAQNGTEEPTEKEEQAPDDAEAASVPEDKSEEKPEEEAEESGEEAEEPEPEEDPGVFTGDVYRARLSALNEVYRVEAVNRGRVTEILFLLKARRDPKSRDPDVLFAPPSQPPYNVSVEDGCFVLTLYSTDGETSALSVSVKPNPLFDTAETIALSDRVRYVFTLKDPENFYGFDLEYPEDGKITVTLRNPIPIDPEADLPLAGVRIVLDAGHGGSDPGAFGPLRAGSDGTGSVFAASEKDLNLSVTLAAAEKLRALGATVILTREGDETFDVTERALLLEKLEPDLCLSLHQNSIGYTSDITKIRGTLGLFCAAGGELLADCVGRCVAASLCRNYRGTQWQALAMCRNPRFPSALIEVGFMTSVEEYEYMLSERGLEAAAQGVADGVLEYFRRMTLYAEIP